MSKYLYKCKLSSSPLSFCSWQIGRVHNEVSIIAWSPLSVGRLSDSGFLLQIPFPERPAGHGVVILALTYPKYHSMRDCTTADKAYVMPCSWSMDTFMSTILQSTFLFLFQLAYCLLNILDLE